MLKIIDIQINRMNDEKLDEEKEANKECLPENDNKENIQGIIAANNNVFLL